MLGIWWVIYLTAMLIVFYRVFKIQMPLIRRNKAYKRLSQAKLDAMSEISIGMLSVSTWDDSAQRKEDELQSLIVEHKALLDQCQANNEQLGKELKITLPWVALQFIALLGTFLTGG